MSRWHDGHCERCDNEVEQRDQEQWMLRITKYADALHDDLEELDWPEEIKLAQKSWIGRSEGAEISFKIKDSNKRKKHIIIDFDGVVGDTFEAGNHAKVEMDGITYEEAAKWTFEHAYNKPTHARGVSPEKVKSGAEWIERFGNAMLNQDLKLFDGFVNELAKLENTKIAFVSSGSRKYINKMLSESVLKPTHILAYEDHHSKEEKVETVCGDWGISVTEAYYLTDAKNDVYELENTMDKKKIFGCDWGYIGFDALAEVLPNDQIMKEFTDIHVLLGEAIPVFTTRPDTLFGATYMVIAPEHKLVDELLPQVSNKKDVEDYISATAKKSELERQQDKEKLEFS